MNVVYRKILAVQANDQRKIDGVCRKFNIIAKTTYSERRRFKDVWSLNHQHPTSQTQRQEIKTGQKFIMIEASYRVNTVRFESQIFKKSAQRIYRVPDDPNRI